MNKTLKKTLKGLKPPKVPDRVKLLSLLAIVLVVAAPALVSIIDGSESVDYTSERSIDYSNARSNYSKSGDYAAAGSLSMLTPDVNDGSFVFVVNTNEDVELITTLLITGFAISDFSNVQQVVMSTDSSPSRITINCGGNGVDPYYIVGTYDSDADAWVFDFNSITAAKLGSGGYTRMTVTANYDIGQAQKVTTLTMTAYGSTSYAYGEIIIGATGALLLVCALFATPWFGVFKKKGVKS